MKTVLNIIAAAGLVGASVMPAFAESNGGMDMSAMTCADYMGMDDGTRTNAVAALMSQGQAMDDDVTKDEGATIGQKSTVDAAKGGDGMAKSDDVGHADMMTALDKACTEDPDMMVLDAAKTQGMRKP